MTFNCVLHGSFRKHYDLMARVSKLFTKAGIKVLAPQISPIASENEGFVRLETDKTDDARAIQLNYLQNLLWLGSQGFSYYVNPEGYVGRTASYELGIDQILGTNVFFQEKPKDLPIYFQRESIVPPEQLADHIVTTGRLPKQTIPPSEQLLYELVQNLLSGPIVAVGAMIESTRVDSHTGRPDIFLVKTRQWGGRYSIVGKTVRRGESIDSALKRGVSEETNIKGNPSRTICAFNELPGYFRKIPSRLFVDKVFRTNQQRFALNHQAEKGVWISPDAALKELDIEPNAKMALEAYLAMKPY